MANPPTDPDLLARGLAPAVGMKYKALFPAKRNPRYGIGDDRKETHPRWSQEIETDIGTGGRRPTLLYNGYEQQVGSMYDGKEV